MKAAGLIRSGWWIVAAAAVVTVVVVGAVLRASLAPGRGRGADTIALEPSLIDRDTIVTAMARDGLQALTAPAVMTPTEVDAANQAERGKLLVSSDLVVGVTSGLEARAYPLRLLRWHEAVNDTIGGLPVAVTYSPLSGAIAVWDRRSDGRVLELAVSGRLWNSNTLLYDRRPDGGASSLWHQLTGEAVTGPAAGRRLEPLPAALATWADWLLRHPETTVMAPDPGSSQLYRRDPYHSYRGSDLLRFPVDPLAPEGALARKDRVAVVGRPGREAVYALPYLAQAVGAPRGSWAASIDGVVQIIDFDSEAETLDVAPREPEAPAIPVRFAYWFEWYALHPDAVPLP